MLLSIVVKGVIIGMILKVLHQIVGFKILRCDLESVGNVKRTRSPSQLKKDFQKFGISTGGPFFRWLLKSHDES